MLVPMVRTPSIGSFSRRRAQAGAWSAALVALAAMAPRVARGTSDDDQFRQDTILCEEALAHLMTCCPDFDSSRVQCTYYFSDDGCDDQSETTLPSFDIAQSTCIAGMACGSLAASGICARAASGDGTCP